MNRLTSRERLLLCLFAGTLFLMGSLFLFGALARRHVRLRADLVATRAEIASMQSLVAEAGVWSARAAWLNATQPRESDPGQAGVQLLEKVKAIARAQDVLLENPELGSLEAQPFCQAVSVAFSTKCSWPSLVKFLHAVQAPGRFLVFETATLQADPGNAARMHCQFKIAQWYAL